MKTWKMCPGLLTIAWCAVAQCNTIQSLLLSTTLSGSNTIYTYEIELTPNNGLQAGAVDPSALVILDFPGFISAATASSGTDVTATTDWNLYSDLTGAAPLPDSSYSGGVFALGGFLGNIQGSDSATINNIILQYAGSGLPVVSGPFNTTLIHLAVTSSHAPDSTVLLGLSRDTSSSGIPNEVNGSPVLLTRIGGVPEPASLSLLALGSLGLLMRRQSRRRSTRR